MATSIRHTASSLFRNLTNGIYQTNDLPLKILICRLSSTTDEEIVPVKKEAKKSEKISIAMKAFLKSAKDHENMLIQFKEEYELGRRHLANIMGIHPDNMTKMDVKIATRYLLPSGLFDKEAQPQFKHPSEFLPPQRAAAFNEQGRPHHYQFYTGKPNYYGLMSEAARRMEEIKSEEIKYGLTGTMPKQEMTYAKGKYEWISYGELEKKFTSYKEKITEDEYRRFVVLMERFTSMRLRQEDKDFIQQYGNLIAEGRKSVIPTPCQPYTDKEGKTYMVAKGYRKTSIAKVTVYGNGTGIIDINGKGIDYFDYMLSREQVLFPLALTGMLNKVDVYAEVKGGGPTGQGGAIRHGLSHALIAFVDQPEIDKMAIAGLLTRDARCKERKKPGQKKARKEFTWNPR